MAACRSHTKSWNTLLILVIVVLVNKGVSLDVRGKPANQSTESTPPPSNKQDGSPRNVLDGNLRTSSHTDYPENHHIQQAWTPYYQNPWWRLDLQAVYCIRKITIINRQYEYPAGADRILGAKVQVGLKPYYDETEVRGTVSSDQVTSFTRVIQFIAERPITARYVGVYLNGTSKFLHMAEVMVEEFIDEQTIAAKAISVDNAVTTQISTASGRSASNAVNRAFKYVYPYCSQTGKEMNPWWRLELTSTQCVRKILVKGRDGEYTIDREVFQGATVGAGLSRDPTENTVCGQQVTEYQAVANNWIEFDCKPPYGVNARYISININRTSSTTRLSLCEVIPLPCDLPQDDITFVASPALLGSTGDDDAALTAYKGPTDIGAGVSFGRQLATGGGFELPQGSVEESDSSLGCAGRRLLLPAAGGIDRTGVFYFDAWQDKKEGEGTVATRIQAVILPKDDTVVHIRPAQRTQTANIGDSVTLEMRNVNSPNTNYRWKHNGAALPLGDDQLSVSIADATTSVAGVYSCFTEGRENEQLHGITRLIVRGCRAGLWGPPSCSFPCRRCYNGGVCNENSGTCICAPGFSGIYCEKVHGRNVFGQGASFRCSEGTNLHDSACRGRLFCLPDPYGCSCAAGYMGLDCMQECAVGMYGADCKQTCHCASGVACNKDNGKCTNGACDSQYFGINCQCTRQEASPGRVTASSVEKREVTFHWVEPSCPSRVGVINGYQYKLTAVESGLISYQDDTDMTFVEITGLVPYTEYSFHVAAKTAQGVGPFSEGIIVRTLEAEPTKPLNVMVETGDEMSLTIVWAEPNPPQGVIPSYVIRHERIGTEYSPVNIPNVGTTPLLYKITGLTLNATYSIQVRAWTSEGVGPWSDAIIDTVVGVPGPIRNLRVTNKGERSLTLNWEAPLKSRGPLPRYLVEYRALEKRHISNFTPMNEYVTIDVDSPPYTQDNLDPGSKYEFRVAAKNHRFTGNYLVDVEYTGVLKNPPQPNSPKTLPDKTTATTVTVDLSSSLTGIDVTFATSFVIDVKKLTPMSKREALEPRRYEDSPDNYITADIPKGNVPETFTVGDGQMFGGYYNAPLQTNGEYAVKVGSVTRGNGTERYVTYSDEINIKVSKPSPSSSGGIIAAIVIVIIFVIIVGLVVLIIWMKKRRQSPQPTTDVPLSKVTSENKPATRTEKESSRAPSTPRDHGIASISRYVSATADEDIYESLDILPSWASKWRVDWKDLIVEDKILGKGNFGEVRAGGVKVKGQVIKAAIKTLKGGTSKKAADDFMKEVQTMAGLEKHPNVVALLGACLYQGILHVALEYLPNDNLRNYLRSNRPTQPMGATSGASTPLTFSNLLSFGTDVAEGMEHLSAAGVIHRDLAARNILLAEDLTAKVSDFGLSRGESIYIQESSTRIPMRWLAIESLTSQVYVPKSDVWSFGILLWEIASFGGTPYAGMKSHLLAHELLDGYRMPKPSNCPDEMYDLMQKCWKKKIGARPSFAEIVRILLQMKDVTDKHASVTYENFGIIQPDFDDR